MELQLATGRPMKEDTVMRKTSLPTMLEVDEFSLKQEMILSALDLLSRLTILLPLLRLGGFYARLIAWALYQADLLSQEDYRHNLGGIDVS